MSNPIVDVLKALGTAMHKADEIHRQVIANAEGKSDEERLHEAEYGVALNADSLATLSEGVIRAKVDIERKQFDDFRFYTGLVFALAGHYAGTKVEAHDVDAFMTEYIAADHSDLGDEPSFEAQGVDLANAFIEWLRVKRYAHVTPNV